MTASHAVPVSHAGGRLFFFLEGNIAAIVMASEWYDKAKRFA